MKEHSITDIFFDLDHTLWDFDRNSKLAFGRVFKTHEVAIDLDEFLKIYIPINHEYWRLYREDKITKEHLRLRRLGDSFSRFNVSYPDEILDVMAVSYIDELPVDNHLFVDTLDVLNYLFPKYKLHIITNGFEEVQHKKIKNSNIDHFFATVTTSEEVGVKKPNPLVFEHALEKAKTTPQKSLMIGDSFEADILGAEIAGLQTIFYNYHKDSILTNHTVVETLSQIKKLL